MPFHKAGWVWLYFFLILSIPLCLFSIGSNPKTWRSMIHEHPNTNAEFEYKKQDQAKMLSGGLTHFPGIRDRKKRREGVDLGDRGTRVTTEAPALQGRRSGESGLLHSNPCRTHRQ